MEKDKQPLFTIITVCLNSQETIEATVRSVLDQECKDYEYIIVDGCSSDHTVRIIKTYEELFEGRMTIVSEKDKGLYDAMNKGIGMASGRFINFLNSDDSFTRHALQAVEDTIREKKVPDRAVLYGDSFKIYRNSAGSTFCRHQKAPSVLRGMPKDLNQGMCGVSHQSMFVGLEVFKELGGFDLRFHIHADWDFFIRSLRSKIRYFHVGQPIVRFYMYGLSNQIDCKERHAVRKKNCLYRWVDYYYLRDQIGVKALLRKVLGKKGWEQFLFYYHSLKKKVQKDNGQKQ